MSEINLSNLMTHLLYQFSDERELARSIEELSVKFTKDRHKIGDYLKDPRLVSAYTAFYLLTNIPKFEAIHHWLPESWLVDLKKSSLIDLGAGPGTFSLAWKVWGGEGSVFQIETSALMRDQGKKLWDGFFKGEKLQQMSRWESPVISEDKFLLFGHSANEMGPELALDYIKKINPKHILFIEPGTKEFFPHMLTIRQALIESGFNILYPCPNSESCPMSGDPENWCHQFIQVKHDPETERLSQIVSKDRSLLPLTVHAFSRQSYGPNPSERIVRVLPDTKFSFEWDICHQNQLERYQIMKKSYSKSEVKELLRVLAGASILTEVDKVLEKSKRVKLLKVNS